MKELYLTDSWLIGPQQVEEVALTIENASKDSTVDVEVEGFHIESINRNHYFYERPMVEATQQAWVQPYGKPVLLNHDALGEAIGRIQETRIGPCMHGGQAQFFGLKMFETAKDKVKTGQYLTVSIGVYVQEARCSICNQNIVEEFCEHKRGKSYEGKSCYWFIKSWRPKELSFVNIPADDNAIVVKVFNSLISTEENASKLDTLASDITENDIVSAVDLLSGIVRDKQTLELAAGYEEEAEAAEEDEEGNTLDLGTTGQAIFAHRLLHLWNRNPGENNWSETEVQKWHERVVNALVREGVTHNMVDALDDTLHVDLKEKSRAKKGPKSSLTVQNSLLQARISQLEVELSAAHKLTTLIGELRAELQEAQASFESAGTELETLRSQIAEHDTAVAGLEQQIREQEEETQAAAEHVVRDEAEIARLNSELETLRADNQEFLSQAHLALAEQAYTLASVLDSIGEREEALAEFAAMDQGALQAKLEELRGRHLQSLTTQVVEDPTLAVETPGETEDATQIVNSQPNPYELANKVQKRLFKSNTRANEGG